MKRRTMKMRTLSVTLPVLLIALAAILAWNVQDASASGITVYQNGEKYVKIGGRIQLQYHFQNMQTATTDPAGTDRVFFRRLRPFIEGSVAKDWKGKFQWDMGEATDGNEISIKDAYMEYNGFKNLKIDVGNAYFRFSREALTSSKHQQLVERTFVGDHNYGSPDRNAGVHVQGALLDKKVTYGVSAAIGNIDPDSNKLDFDSPVNRNSDFNQGYMAGARVSFHPFGFLPMVQGDHAKGPLKATITIAGFGWQNDDDNNTYTNASGRDTSGGKKLDVDNVEGLEVSGALRYQGISVDAEYNSFRAETVDNRATGGIYRDGSTTLENLSIEGGYMILANRLEVVAGFQRQDADNYAKKWRRASVGLNYFVKGDHIKGQVTYRNGQNVKGVDGDDEDEVFVQVQYVF